MRRARSSSTIRVREARSTAGPRYRELLIRIAQETRKGQTGPYLGAASVTSEASVRACLGAFTESSETGLHDAIRSAQ